MYSEWLIRISNTCVCITAIVISICPKRQSHCRKICFIQKKYIFVMEDYFRQASLWAHSDCYPAPSSHHWGGKWARSQLILNTDSRKRTSQTFSSPDAGLAPPAGDIVNSTINLIYRVNSWFGAQSQIPMPSLTMTERTAADKSALLT